MSEISASERGPHWRVNKRPSSAKHTNVTCVEVYEWVQPSHCHQHEQFLRHGHMLRWMDIAACLSAEKHAKVPCVTVSVDDITFSAFVKVGHVVHLKAVVNRAFTSSLEVGVEVRSEDPHTGDHQHVCNALFVFVARPKDGIKIKLSQVAVVTEAESKEYLLAGERRRMRVTYAKDLERELQKLQRLDTMLGSDESKSSKKVSMSETRVHTVQIVLPVHANHHGTTFGGQIMEWMTDIATISALRLCRCEVVLEGIQSVIFRGSSSVGERVSLKSSVNKVFSNNKFEVGVRVEGFEVGGEARHINSAFYMFRTADSSFVIPELIADTQVEEERANFALARHCLWLDRKAIQYDKGEVALNSENVYDLIYKNASMLMTNFVYKDWEIIQKDNTFEYCKHQEKDNLIVKCSDILTDIPASFVFGIILNFQDRPKWDFLCKHVRVIKQVTEDDYIVHLVNSTHDEKQSKDFVLLASKRQLSHKSGDDTFLVAYSSVTTSDLPPLRDYQRSSVMSSGYIVEELSGENACRLTYVHQLGSSTMPFFAKDMIGASTLVHKLYFSMKAFIVSALQSSQKTTP